RWAKLQLPNKQKAQSVWFEDGSVATLRRTSCVENGDMRIADVQFYFCMHFGGIRYPLAMVRLFSPPDKQILQDSSDTVYLCDIRQGRKGLRVVNVRAIHLVVCMFP
ncbi:hypothetical protein EI94DRAFT_1540456, partial [Lactarius quietus]